MIYALILAALLIAGFFIYTHKVLGGESLTKYDGDRTPTFETPDKPKGIERLNAYLSEMFGMHGQSANASTGWAGKRKAFDAAGLARKYDCEFRTDHFTSDGATLDGDWTLVKGADPNKRILYIHGGAFTVGSAVSHRPITYNIAKQTGCAVFAPNYRLMPEHSRQTTIDDSRAAYDWVLGNGPNGPATAQAIGVAGDSAGGNLALMVSHWSRDSTIRRPDAVVALSPITDATISGPTMKANLDTDIILTPLLKPILKAPRTLLLWALRKSYGMSPSAPVISPVFDDLADLPPTLVHASTTEMLYDDGARYAAKAKIQGSPVSFQSWANLPHVWQIFDDYVQEAHQALDEIGAFFTRHGVSK